MSRLLRRGIVKGSRLVEPGRKNIINIVSNLFFSNVNHCIEDSFPFWSLSDFAFIMREGFFPRVGGGNRSGVLLRSRDLTAVSHLKQHEPTC